MNGIRRVGRVIGEHRRKDREGTDPSISSPRSDVSQKRSSQNRGENLRAAALAANGEPTAPFAPEHKPLDSKSGGYSEGGFNAIVNGSDASSAPTTRSTVANSWDAQPVQTASMAEILASEELRVKLAKAEAEICALRTKCASMESSLRIVQKESAEQSAIFHQTEAELRKTIALKDKLLLTTSAPRQRVVAGEMRWLTCHPFSRSCSRESASRASLHARSRRQAERTAHRPPVVVRH